MFYLLKVCSISSRCVPFAGEPKNSAFPPVAVPSLKERKLKKSSAPTSLPVQGVFPVTVVPQKNWTLPLVAVLVLVAMVVAWAGIFGFILYRLKCCHGSPGKQSMLFATKCDYFAAAECFRLNRTRRHVTNCVFTSFSRPHTVLCFIF